MAIKYYLNGEELSKGVVTGYGGTFLKGKVGVSISRGSIESVSLGDIITLESPKGKIDFSLTGEIIESKFDDRTFALYSSSKKVKF